MEVGQGLEQRQRQTLAMTPAQLQKLEILAMGNQELMRFLEDEQMENPMLDYESYGAAGDEYVVLGEWFRRNDYSDKDDKAVTNEEMECREVAVREQITLKDYLKSQIGQASLDHELQRCVEQLLDYIDESTGYFDEPKEYLQCILKCDEQVFKQALSVIRDMEPAGAGAFNLSDCLKIQLRREQIADPLLEVIIDEYLEDVAAGNINRISRSLKVSTEKVKRCVRIIKNMNPRPAKGFGTDDTVYIIPDITAFRDKNGWEVTIRNSGTSRIRLNSMYMQMALHADEPELKNYFEEKITRAKNIIKAIEQRESTIRQVALCALKYQEGFALGIGRRNQLTMKQVADELSVHPSTVSRAVKEKYIELPSGVYAFRDLFQASQETEQDTGGSEQEKVISAIIRMVEVEDKRTPMSDQKIAGELENEGIFVARRTIAKYRELAGIRKASERKEKC